MATVNLEISSVISNSFYATIGNASADDGTYTRASVLTQKGSVTMDNLPGAAASINSIQVVLKDTYIELRGGRATWEVDIRDSSSSYYVENVDINDRNLIYTLTSRTTSDGSNAWTLATINDLQLNIAALGAIPNIGVGMFLDYVYVIVDYNTGYGNAVNGVAAANIGKVNGVATADIDKVNGV
jgi:hypothetical protein